VINILPIAVGGLVLAAAGTAVYLTFREPKQAAGGDDYLHALEQWIEGNLDEAAALLYRVVHDDPDSVEPFLQLGNLLRLQGDAERAAVLHRGLTVRSNLTLPQQLSIGLSLADDLNALGHWEGSRDILDTLPRVAMSRTRYWKTRFTQWHGLGDHTEAARTLKTAPRQCPEEDRPWFLSAFASYQLDRALTHALAGEAGEAKSRLKEVKNIAGTQSRIALVRAIMAAVENDAAGAVSIASDSLLDSPEELDVFLPLLQEVLLQSGQFERSLPILERACQTENAPPSLWIDLAMLYEKLGHRDKAIRLLEGKSGRGPFTPDAAAPYLKMLVEDAPASDFGKVWGMLSMPVSAEGWSCRECSRRDERIRWFCPSCHGFHTYGPGICSLEVG
jgi:lipopolysaccharide biosynthesis regulator YciM